MVRPEEVPVVRRVCALLTEIAEQMTTPTGMQGLPLSPDLMAEIEPKLAARRAQLGKDCISELSFSNFHLFREAHQYRYVSGAWPHIIGRTYDGAHHVTPLFDPTTAPVEVLTELLTGCDCLYPLAAAEVATLDPQRFALTSMRDDSDYLYASQVFRDYTGVELRKKRQAVAQLQTTHALSCEPLSMATRDVAAHILQDWMRDKNKQSGEADEAACAEALANAEFFGLEGWLFRADGEPAGFVLAQPLAPRTVAMRFAKGLDAYPGIYPHMFQSCCRHWGNSVQWLNFEQDLGNSNFRRTKLSFHPEVLLEKFRVSLRPTQHKAA